MDIFKNIKQFLSFFFIGFAHLYSVIQWMDRTGMPFFSVPTTSNELRERGVQDLTPSTLIQTVRSLSVELMSCITSAKHNDWYKEGVQ